MEPAKTIRPQDWMSAPESRMVMSVLNETGEAPQALFVGGCVRNCLLGIPVEDVDIATVFTPEEVQEKLQAAGIKTVPTGMEHGTVTAVTGERSYEITTLREDVETDGRHAVVKFTQDWKKDAQRRDFTINTLLSDIGGHIYDPVGCGLADLEARRVVFVGDPARRIEEDVLRILRFFRFHAHYGQGEPDAAALAACRAQAHKVRDLSRERVSQEFLKLMAADRPGRVLKIMFENNVLDIFSFNKDEEEIDALCALQDRYKLISIAARLFVLACTDMENLAVIKGHLIVPKAMLREIEAIDQALGLDALNEERMAKIAVYNYGRNAAAQALLIRTIQDQLSDESEIGTILEIILNWKIPKFPVTGEDLIKQGYKPGPALGRKLKELEEEWIEKGFKEI